MAETLDALDKLVATMQEDLAEARAGVATAVRDERKLRDEYEYRRSQAETMLERGRSR
jgi:phage shock protein A